MAIVTNLIPGTRELKEKVKETEVEYQEYQSQDGTRYLQLISTGSKDRKEKGTASQNLRFDRNRAHELVDILLKAFPR